MPDIFDRIAVDIKDIFDRIKLDVFDRVELDVEDKVIFSKGMADFIKEEFQKQISNIPIGKFVSDVIRKEMAKREASETAIKSDIQKELFDAQAAIKKDIDKLKAEEKDLEDKLKNKYADLRNEIMAQPRYQFGGFSPQVNDLNIGLPSEEGSWRIVIAGTTLSVQRRESDNWVEKGSFVP